MSQITPPIYPHSDDTVQVRRGRVDCVDLYEVKESELSILENGDSTNLYLNFSIFLLSIAFSSIVAICTSTFKKPIYETVAIVIAVLGIMVGGILFVLWIFGRKKISKTVGAIKYRIESQYVSIENSSDKPKSPQ